MKVTSESSTALGASLVARSRFSDTARRVNSASSASTTGARPELMSCTLSQFGSTPVTTWPRSARHAADTAPTYPSPNMLILILIDYALRTAIQLEAPQEAFRVRRVLVNGDAEDWRGLCTRR